MIHQSPEELIEYNARLKAQRDERARLLHACEQGFLKLPVWTNSRFAANLRQQPSDCVL